MKHKTWTMVLAAALAAGGAVMASAQDAKDSTAAGIALVKRNARRGAVSPRTNKPRLLCANMKSPLVLPFVCIASCTVANAPSVPPAAPVAASVAPVGVAMKPPPLPANWVALPS